MNTRLDDLAKHDAKWVGIWGAATIAFALIGGIGRNGWWIGALITGIFFVIYGIAKFDEWRDRRALAMRDDEDGSGTTRQPDRHPSVGASESAR
jgi:hypothetical protein